MQRTSHGVGDRAGLDHGTAGQPVALQVEITSRCNLKCRMCPLTTGGTASSLATGDMQEADWNQVLELAERTRQVFVSGFGEPFSSPRSLEFLKALDARGVTVTLVTNGVAVSEVLAAELASLTSVVHVNVSIDTPDPETYRRIRGGSLNRALRGLANIMRAMDNPLRVSVSSVAMAETVPTLVAFPPILESFGVKHFIIQGLWEYNDYCGDHGLLGVQELRQTLEDIVEDGARRGIDVQLTLGERTRAELSTLESDMARFRATDAPLGPGRTRQCTLPWELPYIDKDGRVFSCCNAASVGSEALGDLSSTGFDDVWNGRAYRQFRLDLIEGTNMPVVCTSCTAVPLGRHPLADYAGNIEAVDVSDADQVTVRVRNLGAERWARGEVLIGSHRPRDAQSPLWHSSWFRHNRPGSFVEVAVAPGEVATFVFNVSRAATECSAHFAVVAEHVSWLSGTEFSVPPSGNCASRISAGRAE